MPVTISGIDEARKRFTGADRAITQAVADHLMADTATPIVAGAKARARSSLATKAMGTLTVDKRPSGALVSNRGGSSLGHIVYAGSEYGGQRRRTTYARRAPHTGTVHTVHQRRTTMMFPEFLGRTGYQYWPSVRKVTHGIFGRVENVVREVIEHG